MSKYFKNVKTIEELKKAYFQLANKNHPDHGGDLETMKAINAEYAEMQQKLKNIHTSWKNEAETYTATEETTETPEDFINIVNELFKMDGLDIELCGRWLWIGGNTKENKEQLKALGCRWSSKKKLWSWHFPEEGAPRKHKAWSMGKIRGTYGSQTVRKPEDRKELTA